MPLEDWDPFTPYNIIKGCVDLTPHWAWWGLPGCCQGLKRWEQEVRKGEVIKLASERLGVAESVLEGCWASWAQPAVGLIPKSDTRVGNPSGTYGEYGDRHLLRLMLGYRLAGRGHRHEISIPSPDAYERGQLVVGRLQEEAARRHSDLGREQAFARLLEEEPHLYEHHLNELKEGRWKFSLRPGLLAKLIDLLENHKVQEVWRNEAQDGQPLTPLRVPLPVWRQFIREFALALAELEVGHKYQGTTVEEDDIACWSTDDEVPTWRLRGSKAFLKR